VWNLFGYRRALLANLIDQDLTGALETVSGATQCMDVIDWNLSRVQELDPSDDSPQPELGDQILTLTIRLRRR
jgi:hypothetical protein